MKKKGYLLTGLVFGIVVGWALGFLRLPYLEKNFSFLLGFVAALACVSLVLLLLNVWNSRLIGKKTVDGPSNNTSLYTYLWTILAGVLLLGGIVSGFAIYRRIESLKLQIQKQDKDLQKMAVLVEFVKKQNLEPLMRNLLDDVGKELKRKPGSTLHDTTIARIAALSLFFKPYQYIDADSLSEAVCSPERGQLLQALILMKIDSVSFARIKRKALFAGADLRGADLKGLDLSGINLAEANLKNADLAGVNLSGANLSGANLWGVNLNQVNLSHADLKKADLNWAKLNGATLNMANLNGVTLMNAQLIQADLSAATVQFAQLGGALFNDANLTRVNFSSTNLTKANLSRANLSDADLREINLSEADVVGIEMNKAVVDENWLEQLKKWQPNGAKELQDRYTVVNDTFDQWKIPMYRLKKIE